MSFSGQIVNVWTIKTAETMRLSYACHGEYHCREMNTGCGRHTDQVEQ